MGGVYVIDVADVDKGQRLIVTYGNFSAFTDLRYLHFFSLQFPQLLFSKVIIINNGVTA